ncbi:uncharacterized protein LOC116033283 [Ipomoea triloba]|uniref:uncharacterized protein LOC116033283 n=1 Tax=Ipomoea triloba TaxID=35885 RepID=UPI00125D1A6A|nr:uncharacterized protein LOC116033283 [Ipomoea triloba]
MIDPISGSWDLPILHDLFDHTDVERILKIPISSEYEDSWFWDRDPRGCYTVKDGDRRIIGTYVTTPGTFDNWLHLWKIKSPTKWKTFVWRTLTNILPTTTNLIIKRVDVDPQFPMCGIVHENIMHALILCDFSRLVWHESTLHISSVVGDDFGVWFNNVLSVFTEDEILVTLAVLYYIWKAQNMAVWEGSLPRPKRTWQMAQAAVTAWRHVHPLQHQNLVASTPDVPTALTSHVGVHPPKCYFDAGFQAATKKSTAGAVLISADGAFLAAFSAPLADCFSPLMAESMACTEVLSWLRNRGATSVDLYTDCSNLRRLLTTQNTNLFSYVAFSIDAARTIMSTFTYCSVSLIPRTANQAAHTLAATAYA